MDRRYFLSAGLVGIGSLLTGCRNKQFAQITKPGQPDMVASHQAGAETFTPLVQESVAKLLGRQAASAQITPVSYGGAEEIPAPRKRICFVAVENKSAEEVGDFKDQLYQIIDTKILESQMFEPVSKRYVDAGLMETRLRPDQLFLPENMRVFTGFMEQAGQPFDYLLYATITSGTTRENQEFQRDYLLTLELVNIRTGQAEKESATITKTYHKSRVGRWFQSKA
ncbi:MAG: penicillin-binding protein activator LpoB [Planctomycetota bacterium]|nr:penicillin-binding protein activator LpoB [Planctomycetota bacterium]